MFYATDDLYCHAVLTAIIQLSHLNKADHIDIVVIHFCVSERLVHCLQDIGCITIEHEPNVVANHDYYRYSFLKLRIFQIEQYDRILFLDADSLPLQNLDHLFLTEMEHSIYMPEAYWIDSSSLFFTSAFILLQPSVGLYEEIMTFTLAIPEPDRGFDMDIINAFFSGNIGRLNPVYCCLNSEWEVEGQYNYFGNQNESPAKVKNVHFSALGKPWQYHPDQLKELRPNANPFFYKIWLMWWNCAKEAQQLVSTD